MEALHDEARKLAIEILKNEDRYEEGYLTNCTARLVRQSTSRSLLRLFSSWRFVIRQEMSTHSIIDKISLRRERKVSVHVRCEDLTCKNFLFNKAVVLVHVVDEIVLHS